MNKEINLVIVQKNMKGNNASNLVVGPLQILYCL